MIKAVLFDLDGVITTDPTGSQSICNYISKETGVEKDIFAKEYKKYNNDLLYGRINHEEIWCRICIGINEKISIQVLYDSFIHTPINNEMFQLIEQIKSRDYLTGMVTDNKKDRLDSIVEFYGLDIVFDAITISAVIGSGKEDDEIFLKTMQKLKVSPDECIFIDNQEKNLIIPKRMGMKSIFYDHNERNLVKLLKEIKCFGVEL